MTTCSKYNSHMCRQYDDCFDCPAFPQESYHYKVESMKTIDLSTLENNQKNNGRKRKAIK